MKTLQWSLAFLLVAGVAGCGGCGVDTTSPLPEIASEKIEKRGDTWHVEFTSTFAAPVDQVYQAFSEPEKAHEFVPEVVLKSELVKAEGNTKLIDLVARLEILPPGFKVQNLRNEYTFFPAEKRFTSRSIDFSLADINSESRFEPSADGKGTTLRFTQTSKDKAPLIVESLQKGALREIFATTVRFVNERLGLAAPAAGQPQG